MLCCKGYVRDMAVKYGPKVVYEGFARYLEFTNCYISYLSRFKQFLIQYSLFESK